MADLPAPPRLHDNAHVLSGAGEGSGRRLAVVLANAGAAPRALLERLWSRATIAICADGGANGLAELGFDRCPDAVVGDLDSLLDDVRAALEARGTQIVLEPSQDTHDLDKALRWVAETAADKQSSLRAAESTAATNEDLPAAREEGSLEHAGQHDRTDQSLPRQSIRDSAVDVVVLGALGGRLDHEMVNLNMLFTWADEPAFHRLVFVSEQSVTFLLSPGCHRIRRDPAAELRTCGLVPLGGTCAQVRTAGLKWDLDGASLSFGGLISSSNEVVSDLVEVETSAPLLWTGTLRRDFVLDEAASES
mmetsp:Transcript_17506/g.55828  ORF Transcript_17506/g.55828 Transcript_17506/m.55828 type:complete len:306 (-) Transcript_17506:700-1617(-)